MECKTCHGTGMTDGARCLACDGWGRVPEVDSQPHTTYRHPEAGPELQQHKQKPPQDTPRAALIVPAISVSPRLQIAASGYARVTEPRLPRR